MHTLTTNDLHFVLSRVPRDIRQLLMENEIFLAGGFIRATIAGEDPSDIDLLGGDYLKLENLGLKLAEKRGGRTHKTANALTIISPPRRPIQMILRWLYNDAEKLINEFDFTVVQAAIWWAPNKDYVEGGTETSKGEWKSVCSEHFYTDLAARRLRYTFPERHEDAGGSMLRVIKYIKKGYTIQVPSLAGVIARLIAGLRVSNNADQDNRDGERSTVNDGNHEYINEKWARPLIVGLLRDVDPLAIIDGLDFLDEHEIQ